MRRMKKIITALLVFLLLFCLAACANMKNQQASQESAVDLRTGETKDRSNGIGSEKEKGDGNMNVGIFDFEKKSVLLNSGYEMPITGLGTYSLCNDRSGSDPHPVSNPYRSIMVMSVIWVKIMVNRSKDDIMPDQHIISDVYPALILKVTA